MRGYVATRLSWGLVVFLVVLGAAVVPARPPLEEADKLVGTPTQPPTARTADEALPTLPKPTEEVAEPQPDPEPEPEPPPVAVASASEEGVPPPADVPLVILPAPPPAPEAEGWALAIGINRARGSPPLQGAVADATALGEALLEYGFDGSRVRLLLEGEASADAILDSIAWLADNAPEHGRAVFAFAGHTRKIKGVNHLVAADGKTISVYQLAGALSRVRAPMWIAFPTCYAAGFGVDGIVGEGRIVTFASEAHSVSYESRSLGMSHLFYYMVREAMLERRAPFSVQTAFAYAAEAKREKHPELPQPVADDRTGGVFRLGELDTAPDESDSPPPEPPPAHPEPHPAPMPHPPPEDAPPSRPAVCLPMVQLTGCR